MTDKDNTTSNESLESKQFNRHCYALSELIDAAKITGILAVLLYLMAPSSSLMQTWVIEQHLFHAIFLMLLYLLWTYGFSYLYAGTLSLLSDHQKLVYKGGNLFTETSFVRNEHVRHMEIDASVIERMFGVCEVSVYTSGGSGAEIVFPALDKNVAEELLRRYLANEPT